MTLHFFAFNPKTQGRLKKFSDILDIQNSYMHIASSNGRKIPFITLNMNGNSMLDSESCAQTGDFFFLK